MGIFRRIWALGKREHLNSEIDEEMRDHLRRRIDANVAKGMSSEQAARAARLRFGNPAVMKERVDAEDAAIGVDSLLRDTRYALRGFARARRRLLLSSALSAVRRRTSRWRASPTIFVSRRLITGFLRLP